MADDYTPSTDYVRTVYGRCPIDSLNGGPPNPTPEYAEAQFDRWLESVEAAAEQRGAEKERAQIVARMAAAAGMEAGR